MKLKKIFGILLLIVVVIFTIILSNIVREKNRNLSATDSDALYGGDLEFGYPSAGYLVNYQKDSTQRKSCGVAVINNKQAITAAHCVDNSKAVFIGAGEFKDRKSDFLPILQIRLKQNWIKNRSEEDDIAVLFYENDNKFNSFANIAKPQNGCNYHIVAYGQSNDTGSKIMPRKGADVCVSNITNKTFRIIGANSSGICFGDSGSPIYEKDTNKLVGMISSIIQSKDSNEENPCNIGNMGLAIRADSTSELISDQDNLAINENFVTISDLEDTPSDQTLLDKLNLNQQIDFNDPDTQYTIAIISVIITIFGIIVIWIRR